jgi:hypothetical protein
MSNAADPLLKSVYGILSDRFGFASPASGRAMHSADEPRASIPT